MRTLSGLRARAGAFFKNTAGNVAITMALAALPLTLAMGAGVDYARGLAVHSSLTDALDAAGLAVGAATTKPSSNCSSDGSSSATTGNGPPGSPTSCSTIQQLAQQYFNANFNKDSSADTVGNISIAYNSTSESVTLSVNDSVPTTFLAAADRLMGTTKMDSMAVSASSTVVWGQTKLWVALVLDNSGSMSDSDKSGTSKMDALHSAGASLLATLQSASANPGDVEVALVPFDREVNVGTTNKSAAWLYWGFWEEPGDANGAAIPNTPIPYVAASDYQFANPVASSPSTVGFAAFGPGDECPFTQNTVSRRRTTTSPMSPFGYYCTSASANGSGNVDTIPSGGSICPSYDPGTYNPDRHNHYYNGCWTSVKDGTNTLPIATGKTASCTDSNGNGFSSSNCKCSGSGNNMVCSTQRWKHVWTANDHSTWKGCVTDRDKSSNYDIQDTTPVSTSTTGMAADNQYGSNCLPSAVVPLGYSWSDLTTDIQNMAPNGSTNQAIGVANGWLALTQGDPYGTPALPGNTSRYIILLSDGLNTEDRWWGDGRTENTSDDGNIDTRMSDVCTAAKNDHITIFTLMLDVSGTENDTSTLSDCATTGDFTDLTSNSQIATAFQNIAEQITSLRVSN